MRIRATLSLAVIGLILGSSCRSTYYGMMSKLGKEKRDIFVSRVTDARDSQQAASDSFKSALERFSAIVKVDGGGLEKEYKKLNKEYERCKGRAADVNKRISEVEQVSEDLFKEWKKELKQYSSSDLRRKSEQQMRDTRKGYDEMITAMRDAAKEMAPVLQIMGDQVLYLKHNLNSRAIASIRGEVESIEKQVTVLIGEMDEAIAHADKVIAELE